MTTGIRTVIYPVRDLTPAKALYAALLGLAPDMDEPYYVGYTVGGQDVGLDPNGHGQGMTGPGRLLARRRHRDAGQDPRRGRRPGDAGRSRTSAGASSSPRSTDADGNVIGLLQPPG